MGKPAVMASLGAKLIGALTTRADKPGRFVCVQASGCERQICGAGCMGWQIRRVVTGHDSDGRAKVQIDEFARNVIARRPGYQSCVIWSSEEFPADNDDAADAA